MNIEQRPGFGWQRTLVLENQQAEVVITLEVGPRIISYRLKDHANVLKVFDDELGKTGEAEFQIRGGHRLWVAPENELTYFPDNQTVTLEIYSDQKVLLTAPPETGNAIEKQMLVTLAHEGPGLTVEHRIRAYKDLGKPIAPWALTVMKPGGTAIVPMPATRRHPDENRSADIRASDYLPDRHLALWPYTNPADTRLEWRSDELRIHQTPGQPATKIGFTHRLGSVCYINDGVRFTKSVAYQRSAQYPDGNCNLEIFTNGDILELETLGELCELSAGTEMTHLEHWNLEVSG